MATNKLGWKQNEGTGAEERWKEEREKERKRDLMSDKVGHESRYWV